MKLGLLMGFFLFLTIGVACKKASENPKPEHEYPTDYRSFSSILDFNRTWDQLSALSDSTERITRINTFWDSLKVNTQIPFALGDSVVFLYRGSAEIISWAGDFNGWNPNATGYQSQKLNQTNIHRLTRSFPSDARLDYKLVVNNNWILDPVNPYRQYSGFGPNSELRMPDWIFPIETVAVSGVEPGTLSENLFITSKPENLGYALQYKVYTPYNYNQFANLAVIYVTDGHEYADERLGAMTIVLDNLIYSGKMEPIIAVFVDPRNPDNASENRRMDEYRANMRYVNFLADELVNQIDTSYRTDNRAISRAILGTSLGGWNAAFVGIRRSDKFGLIGIHSPAFDDAIIMEYAVEERKPLKIFMSTGVIFDTQNQARQMRDIMIDKGYPLVYTEVNQGHSWGNWRSLLAEPLLGFFPK